VPVPGQPNRGGGGGAPAAPFRIANAIDRVKDPIGGVVETVRERIDAKCPGCVVVTTAVLERSELTQCQYTGEVGGSAKVDPAPYQDGDPTGGYLIITPPGPVILMKGSKPCPTGESSEGGTGGTEEGGTEGTEEGGTEGTDEGGTEGTGEGGTEGTEEGGTEGTDEIESGGSGAGVTETPNPETAGDGAANP